MCKKLLLFQIVLLILFSKIDIQADYLLPYNIIYTPNTVYSVEWSPDGERIAVGGEGYVWIYSFERELLASLKTESGNTTVLRWVNNNDMLVGVSFSTQTQRGRTIIWEMKNYNMISSRSRSFSVANDYIWFWDNQHILGGNGGGDLFIIDSQSGQVKKRSRIISDNSDISNIFIHGFCQSNQQNIVFAITTNGIYSINLEDLSYETVNMQVGSSGDCNPSATLFSTPIGRLVRLDQVDVSYRLSNLEIDYEGNGPEFVVRWNPIYPMIASYTADGLYLWDVFGLNIIEPDNIFRQAGLGGFHSIAWHPSGEYLAQAGKDGAYVNIWHITMEDLLNSQP